MTWLSTMKFFWRLSEKHWLLLPFEWIGDWMEDYGLDHQLIQFNDEIMERLEAHKQRDLSNDTYYQFDRTHVLGKWVK